MNLAICNLTGGGLSGGYQKYLQRIVPLMEQHPGINMISVYVPQLTQGTFDSISKNFIPWPNGDDKRGFEWLRKQISKASPDVVFIPTARYVNFGSIPTVLMVRNMEPLSTPFGGNPFPEAVRNIGRAYAAKKACKQATRVIAVSQHVKDFLTSRWNIADDKIGVVYHGIDSPKESSSTTVPGKLPEQKGNSFIFTAGSIRPARGLEDIIHAYALIYNRMSGVKLVIGGSIDPGMHVYKNKLDALISKYGIASSVVWLGPLSSNEMSWCYSHCSAFVMTSRAEACPNIVLEAMAHGCISISTRTPPMPEFFQNTSLYYPPKDNFALSTEIIEVLSWDNSKRMDVAEKSRKRASQFSWDICAEKTVEQFMLAIEEFKRENKG